MQQPDNQTEKSDAQIGVRVPKDFKVRLERQAKKEHRTLSNLVFKILNDYLEENC